MAISTGPFRALVVTFLATMSAAAEAQRMEAAARDSAPALWAGLQPGPHRVGYQRLDARGGVVHVWYPSVAAGERLRFRAYLGDSVQGLTSFLSGAGVAIATIDGLLESPLHATGNARPVDRAFPLVLVAHGNAQDVTDQVVFCEYLASHGFVVAATPSPMLRTPMEREDQVGALAELQADELAAAIGATANVVRVDLERVAVVGHSFGARAALLLAMRGQPRLQAMVSLDGGIGTTTALEPFRRAPSFRPDAALPPLLHFSEELDAFMTPDFSLLKSLRVAELVLEPTQDMRHSHFTTWGFAAVVFPDLARATRATAGTGSALRAVHEKTAAFLRRSLAGSGQVR
jgi:dienelactone hydrolase